jgi:hypothetical protein
MYGPYSRFNPPGLSLPISQEGDGRMQLPES